MRAVIDRLKDEQWLVRGFAVKILASLGNQAAVKILEEQLKVMQAQLAELTKPRVGRPPKDD